MSLGATLRFRPVQTAGHRTDERRPETTPATLYLISSLHGGGEERLLTNVLLQEREPETVSVVTFLPGGVFRPRLEKAGIRVADLGMVRHRQVLRGVFRLAALIRAWRPARVQGWNYDSNLLALLALLLAGRWRTRLFWGIFNTDVRGRRWIVRVVCRLSALLSPFVDGVAYNAGESRAFHRRLGFRERHSLVITNYVDPDVFRRDAEQCAALRKELGIGEDEVMVVIVARTDPMKDWPSMRAAVCDLHGIVAVAIGTGTDRLPPQPGFVGLGWRDDVVSILSAADLFLLGSAFGEGTSLALNEAMLCGLPCVVTDVGGNAALVGDCGEVVEPGSPATLREAVLRLARDPARRQALGQAARRRAVAFMSNAGRVQDLHRLADRSEAPRPA